MDGETVTLGQSSDARSSLRVIHILVVDDDPTCLAIVAGMLRTYKYDVLAVEHPSDALATLRMKQGLIDLVVTDVHMPDMNGFELQKHVDEEFKLPVVMMSADDRENVMLKGLEEGAAFFMVKPISTDILKNIWQYAIARKKGKSTVVLEETSSVKGSPTTKKNPYNEDIGSKSSVNEEETQKRKEYKKKTLKNVNKTRGVDNAVSKTIRKQKVIWTTSLHNRFLYAINQIGLEKSVPKRILEVMSVPGLTRENVASHLQKYRIFLRRVPDTSNEAVRTLVERVLLRSSFAPSYSSLIYNKQNYPQFSEQQQIKRASQPRLRVKKGHICKVSNTSKLLSYSNQEASKRNSSITPLKYGKSHSSLNKIQANLQPQNHPYQAKSSSVGLKQSNSIQIGDVSSGNTSNFSSNLLNNGTNGLMTNTNGMHLYQNKAQGSSGYMTNIGTNDPMTRSTNMQGFQNEAQATQEVLQKGPINYNFATNGLSSQKYISGIENMGSYNGARSNFNNLMYPKNSKFADTQMTNYGGNFAGYGNQMGGYVGEASNGLGGDYFSNLVQQESALLQPPPSQENDGTDSSNLFGSIEKSFTFNSNSLQPFTEGSLNNIFMQRINDESFNQKGDEKVVDPDFSIGSYHVEAPQAIVQPFDQPEDGEEVISTQKFSDKMYQADSILSWFDAKPNQQQVGEEFVNSELYGMNQTGGEQMVDSFFGIDAYNLMG